MQINGPAHLHGPQAINGPHHATRTSHAAAAQPSSFSQVDQVDISPEASFVAEARELPEIRQDRVAALKAQIESGTYESEDKLDAALDRFLDELA